MPPPPKPVCCNHSALLPLSSQDQYPLLTPTQKQRARMKLALQSAASISDSDTFPVTPESTEIAHVSPVPVKLNDVISQTYKSVPVISESVESTSAFFFFRSFHSCQARFSHSEASQARSSHPWPS